MTAATAVEWGIRGAIPALIVSIVVLALRVRDQTLERRLWRSALVFACAVPLLTLVTAVGSELASAFIARRVTMPGLPALTTAAQNFMATGDVITMTVATRAMTAGLLVWCTVSLLLLLRIAVGAVASWHMVRTSQPAPLALSPHAQVRMSDAISEPATVGSTVLLPIPVIGWNVSDRDAVLAHELNHVASRDFWWQFAARTYAAIYWWSPASWLITARLRHLAEQLSDSAALTVLPDAKAYATLLVTVAAGTQRRLGIHRHTLEVAMARPSMLRTRIDAVIRGLHSVPLTGARRRLALGAPLIAAALMVLPTMTKADEVTIRLVATKAIDADAERLIAASPNPDSVRKAFQTARVTHTARWFVLNPDGSRGATGETPSAFTLPVIVPFSVTYCSADFATEFRVEYKFRYGSGAATQKGCVRIFHDQRGFGSVGVAAPRGR